MVLRQMGLMLSKAYHVVVSGCILKILSRVKKHGLETKAQEITLPGSDVDITVETVEKAG